MQWSIGHMCKSYMTDAVEFNYVLMVLGPQDLFYFW